MCKVVCLVVEVKENGRVGLLILWVWAVGVVGADFTKDSQREHRGDTAKAPLLSVVRKSLVESGVAVWWCGWCGGVRGLVWEPWGSWGSLGGQMGREQAKSGV